MSNNVVSELHGKNPEQIRETVELLAEAGIDKEQIIGDSVTIFGRDLEQTHQMMDMLTEGGIDVESIAAISEMAGDGLAEETFVKGKGK